MRCWEAQVGLGGQTSALALSLPADPSFVYPSPSWEPTPVSLLHMCPPWAPHHWLSRLHSHISPLQGHVFICPGAVGITVPDVSPENIPLWWP